MKIHYKTRHGAAEWVGFEDENSDTLTLVFDPYQSGVLLLGGKTLALKNGEISISKSALADGNYTPKLESDCGVYTVEGFTKIGDNVYPYKADENLVRNLLLRCYNLENEIALFKERVTSLEKICCGHKIFDFERNDK